MPKGKPMMTVDQHRRMATLLAMTEFCADEICRGLNGLSGRYYKHGASIRESTHKLRSLLEDLLFQDNPADASVGAEFYFGHQQKAQTGKFGNFLTVARNDPQFMDALAAYFDEEHS